jgi:hypothetical protein
VTTPYERLLTELIPTRPPPPPDGPPPPLTGAWTAAEQDAHWAELCKDVGTPDAPRPHLRAVPAPDEPAADTDAAEPERHSA